MHLLFFCAILPCTLDNKNIWTKGITMSIPVNIKDLIHGKTVEWERIEFNLPPQLKPKNTTLHLLEKSC